jgi:hypothetical protein
MRNGDCGIKRIKKQISSYPLPVLNPGFREGGVFMEGMLGRNRGKNFCGGNRGRDGELVGLIDSETFEKSGKKQDEVSRLLYSLISSLPNPNK